MDGDDKATRKAIMGSIAKWQRILKAKDVREDGMNNDCPLCAMFLYTDSRTDTGVCYGCPVWRASGAVLCDRTPYQDWSREKMNLSEVDFYSGEYIHFPGCTQDIQIPMGKKWSRKAEAAAKAELIFLRGLLDGS